MSIIIDDIIIIKYYCILVLILLLFQYCAMTIIKSNDVWENDEDDGW